MEVEIVDNLMPHNPGPNKISRIIGKHYVPVQLLKSAAKGNVYLAVSLKNLSFKRCVIKQGISRALADQYNRDIIDRLLWQKSVLQDLKEVATPAYLDYFEEKGCSYLVIQYAAGTTLFQVVKSNHGINTWKTMDIITKRKLLILFLEALNIVNSIHLKGFVHRDITDSNFSVLTDGKLCILDFELSYCMINSKPHHPFLLGTFGYVAPEQLKHAKPHYNEDIYSLAALLCFFLSNIPPVKFITKNLYEVERELNKITSNPIFSKIIIKGLSVKPKERPSINSLKNAVLTYLKQLG